MAAIIEAGTSAAFQQCDRNTAKVVSQSTKKRNIFQFFLSRAIFNSNSSKAIRGTPLNSNQFCESSCGQSEQLQ